MTEPTPPLQKLWNDWQPLCPEPEPFVSAQCCPEHAEAADIRWTRAEAQRFAEAPHRAASVAGVHPEDFRGFAEGRLSLTSAARRRFREWAECRTSEVERKPYVIPASTKPAKEGLR